MGFFYKHFVHPFISSILGLKAYSKDFYLVRCIEADEADLIPDELFRIGMAYYKGESMLPQDVKKAWEYLSKAAERGHVSAQFFLGLVLRDDGQMEEGLNWLQKSASQGHAGAMYQLSISYRRGDIGGEPDVSKCLELVRRAAECGVGAACSRYASLCMHGEDGVKKNLEVAKFWATRALSLGYQHNEYVLKQIIGDENIVDDTIDTTKIYNDAAQAGEPYAMYEIGNAYIEEDFDKAAELWKKASDMGCDLAKINLAEYYCYVKKDYTTANRLLEELANRGYIKACKDLAESFYYGYGVEKDVAKAFYWNEKALNFGDSWARYLLAVMCLEGSLEEIFPDKVTRGMCYMEMAAKGNFPQAVEFMEKQKPKHQ